MNDVAIVPLPELNVNPYCHDRGAIYRSHVM